MYKKGKVQEIITNCTCNFVQDHEDHHLEVFSVPRGFQRWCCSALGAAPILLGAAIVGSLSGVIPENFYDLGVPHVLFVLLLITSYCGAVVIVALSKKHSVPSYLGSGAVYSAMIFGVLSFIRVFAETISALK